MFRSLEQPVLLLWGEDNQTAKFEQHEEVLHILENASTINFFSYPNVGHMAVQEAGALIAVDVRGWLDGDRESGLVQNLPAGLRANTSTDKDSTAQHGG